MKQNFSLTEDNLHKDTSTVPKMFGKRPMEVEDIRLKKG